MKILIIGNTGKASLERTYKRAFIELGHQVEIYDINTQILTSFPFSKVSKFFARNDYVSFHKQNIKLSKYI